jgi:hypothetical protein
MMDEAKLLKSVGGNRALLREMARLCLEEDAPRLLNELRTAVDDDDRASVEFAAHALKGLVGRWNRWPVSPRKRIFTRDSKPLSASLKSSRRHCARICESPHDDLRFSSPHIGVTFRLSHPDLSCSFAA